jgi:sugar lactone lactonase YvrE
VVVHTIGPDLSSGGGGVAVIVDSYCCSVTDSTIAGNVAEGSAAAAGVSVSLGGLRLYGDTIAGNRAAEVSGGISPYFATIDIGGTLLAQNSPQDCSENGGAIISHGGDLADDSSCPVELPGVDPKLQPLANNGGVSQTMAIAASSPAYDANTLCATTDQRTVSRLQLGASRCDIGAYQVNAPSTYVANPAAGSVTAYATGATGDAVPTLTLAGAGTGLSGPTGVIVDVTGKVFVANAGNSSITEYAPEVNGNTGPTATIAGSLTQLSQPQDLALDPQGDLFVTNSNASVAEYAPGATGNVAPKTRIAGSATKLSQPRGIVVDASGALHVTNGNGTVTTYRPGAHGNAAPSGKLTINAGAARPWGLNFDPDGNLVVSDAAASRVDSSPPRPPDPPHRFGCSRGRRRR